MDLIGREFVENTRKCKLDENNTVHLDYIDASVDKGMEEIINYFNNEKNQPTEFCCSGLLKDHYEIEELKQLDFSSTIPREYFFISSPYILFEPIYHRWDNENENTIIDGDFHEFEAALPEGIGVYITSDNFETLEWHEGVSFDFRHKLLTNSEGEEATYKYYYDLGSPDSLQVIFAKLGNNFELYDQLIQNILDSFLLMCEYPEKFFRHIQIRIDKDTEELVWLINSLEEIPKHLEESDITSKKKQVTNIEDGELAGQQIEYWEIAVKSDKLEKTLEGDIEFI